MKEECTRNDEQLGKAQKKEGRVSLDANPEESSITNPQMVLDFGEGIVKAECLPQ